MSTSSSVSTSSLYSQLIDQLILAESKRKFAYEDQKTTQETRKSAISSVGSSITALDTYAQTFLDLGADQFTALKPKSSDEAFFTVSNSGSLSASGSYQIEIQQLAKFDAKVSRQFNSADADLLAAFDSTTFTVNVGADSAVINVDLTGVTDNADVLDRVADAINDAGLENIQATVLKETSSTSRLSIRATETGQDYEISFSDTNDAFTNFLSEALELTLDGGADNNALYGGVNGGRLYNLADLNAQFTIDGLNFTRSSNTVTDAISGLDLTLKKVTTQTEELSISADTESARSEIDAFIASFNKVNSDVRNNSYLDSATGARGPLYSDRVFKELTITLRQTVFNRIDIGGGEELSLADIGIGQNTDGSIFVEDESILTDYLENEGDKVQELFAKADGVNVTDNGIATQLQDAISRFVGADGIITSLQSSIDDRIEFLDDRIEAQESYLETRRRILTDQYAQLEVLAASANSQFQLLAAYSS